MITNQFRMSTIYSRKTKTVISILSNYSDAQLEELWTDYLCPLYIDLAIRQEEEEDLARKARFPELEPGASQSSCPEDVSLKDFLHSQFDANTLLIAKQMKNAMTPPRPGTKRYPEASQHSSTPPKKSKKELSTISQNDEECTQFSQPTLSRTESTRPFQPADISAFNAKLLLRPDGDIIKDTFLSISKSPSQPSESNSPLCSPVRSRTYNPQREALLRTEFTAVSPTPLSQEPSESSVNSQFKVLAQI